MHQHEAVDAVYDLIPQMAGKDPAEVLSKYAAVNDLAPAQLERLGHVFNTASTCSTLEKDRNGTPYLVDVPKMASAYIRQTGTARAAVSFFDDELPHTKAASAVASDVPRLWAAELPDAWSGRTKAAAQTDLAVASTNHAKEAFWTAVRVAHDAVELQADALQDANTAVTKVAHAINRSDHPGLQLATLRADCAVLVKGASALTEIFLDKVARQVALADAKLTAPSFVLARDRTGQAAQVAAAIDFFKQACSAGACLHEATAKVAELAPKLAVDDARVAPAVRKMATEVQRLGKSCGALKEALAQPKEDSDDRWPKPRAPINFRHEVSRAADDVEKTLGSDDSSAWALAGPLARGGVHGALAARQGLGNLIFNDTPAALREFTSDGTIGRALEPLAAKNKERADGHALDREQIVDATRAMATVQKLMATDEILSTKDPEKVFEAFTTIRRASPEVAGDISLLRIMLRNATDYQGVDIDTATASRRYEQIKPGEKPSRPTRA